MRNFATYRTIPYSGLPQALPVKLGGIAGVGTNLVVNWLAYGASSAFPTFAIAVNLNTQANVKLDQIRSIYIDNLASNNPIYVYFSDMNYTLVAPPNSEGWYPVYTNDKKFIIAADGFVTGNIPITAFLVSNLPITPNVNTELLQQVALYLASPAITRGNTLFNRNYGTPALGDQTLQQQVTAASAGASVGLLPNVGSGFYIVTGISIYATQLNDGANTSGTNLYIESTGLAGVLFFFPAILVPTNAVFLTNPNPKVDIYTNNSMQLKLDASQNWRMRNEFAMNSGSFNCIMNYTYTPLT